jgi:DNA-binding PadR family transcriptional regulator
MTMDEHIVQATVVITPVTFQILLALADDDRHGYGIMQDVAQRTESAMHLNTGTLYRALKHLLEAGLISESDERPDPTLDDARRRYYRLTAAGRRAAEAEAARLEQLVRVARAKRLLEPVLRPGEVP